MTDVAADHGSIEDEEELSRQVALGNQKALEYLLDRNRLRLKRMVSLRLAPELAARLDGSDVIQEAFLQAALNVESYEHDPDRPFYFWIRKITENKILEAHRCHVLAAKREVGRETKLDGNRANVSSAALANVLMQSSGSNPLSKAMRLEIQRLIQEELEELSPVDREVLVMRHFEQMSLSEIGKALEISKAGAAKRYRVALERLRTVMVQYPGLL